MIGKFVLVAFLCVSLTQVQGNELEEAIKDGLIKVRNMYEGGERKINGSIDGIGYKSKAVEIKTRALLFKATTVQLGAKKALRDVAKAMEEKAKELNKTESVFACIQKTEKKANDQIQAVVDKFKLNITNLEKATLDKIKTASEPLFKLREALRAEYQKVVKTIKACKTVSCVEQAVSGCGKWLNQMNADIGKVFEQVGVIVGNHGKEAGNLTGSQMSQVNQIKADGIRDIKKCVFG